MKLTPEQKAKVIEIVAPFVSPKDIEANFPQIENQMIYYYCNKNQIPKWRPSVSKRKSDAIRVFETTERELKEQSIKEARRFINACY